MEIYKDFTFDAAHYLPNVPDGHKCKRLHGHTYRLRVWIAGEVDEKLGWVMDYADVASAVQPVLCLLDHHELNSVPGLENPTTEVVAAWLWERLRPALEGLSGIDLGESSTTGCMYP